MLVASMSANVSERFRSISGVWVADCYPALQIVNIPQPQTPYNAAKAGT